jgi:hypothetical protein
MILFFGIFLTILGTIGFIYGFLDLLLSVSCRNWVKTIGKIRQSGMNQTKSNSTSSFIPELKYEYSVEGNTFVSDKLYFGLTSNLSSFEANQFLSRIGKNSKVTVFYNRLNPHQSVLVARNIKTSLLKLWFGILPLVIGIFLIYSMNPNFVFWFFLLWFFPVIFLTRNYSNNPYNNIEILDN